MGLEDLYTPQKQIKKGARKSSIDAVINSGKFKDILPEDTIRSLLMDVDTNISLKQVILSDENKNKLKQFLAENKHRNELLQYDLRPMNRILCYGASGCGKTFTGKALSNELNYTMLYVDIAECLSQDQVAVNLTNVFRLANVGECLVFLDECDSIAWNRESKNAESGTYRRATNSLFQLMDQLTPDSIIFCATNMLNRLDPAFERRFDLKMEFSRPSLDLIASIKHFKRNDFMLIQDIPDDKLNMIKNRLKTHKKLSYYEIEGLTHRAMKKAILTNTKVKKDNKMVYANKLSWITDELEGTMKIKQKFRINEEDVSHGSD